MTPAGPAPDFDTVILAGGSAARMAGADKPALAVGGTPMLVSVARAAAAAGTQQLIVVGPQRPGAVQAGLEKVAAGLPGRLTYVREYPPGRGPVAGLRRGLAEVAASWLVLLAADLPFLTAAHLEALLATGLSGGSQGAVVTDESGRAQWLAGCWQASSLRLALAGYDGTSLHSLLTPLAPVLFSPGQSPPAQSTPAQSTPAQAYPAQGRLAPAWLDCDTPDDLAAARRAWPAHQEHTPG